VRQTLILHPDSRCPAVKWIVVEVERPSATALKLHYKLAGTIDDLLLPAWAEPVRTNELWRHTCFELFLRPNTASGYLEFNFSPSTQWAAYRFTGHKDGGSDAPDTLQPRIRFVASGEGLALMAVIDNLPPDESWRLGLSAVIEERNRRLSYWALAHPPGRAPDFHDQDCFVLEVGAADSP